MRRSVQTLVLTAVSLLLVALPAAAADDGPNPPAEGFGAGMWDGLLLALVFGVIMGIVVFIDAYSGKDVETAAHHDDGHH